MRDIDHHAVWLVALDEGSGLELTLGPEHIEPAVLSQSPTKLGRNGAIGEYKEPWA